MNANLVKPVGVVLALALLFATVEGIAGDTLHRSFDRMLGQPIEALVPADARNVYAPNDSAVTGHDDRVAASFARMFGHTPSDAAPRVPADFGPDPLATALVEPLRQSISESAQATRMAIAGTPSTRR